MILSLALLAQLHTLLPAPAEISFSPGRLAIDSSFRIRFEGTQDDVLRRAADRFVLRLLRVAGLKAVGASDSSSAALVVSAAGEEPGALELGADESYRLDVTPSGARLTSARPLGILRGLETILQLIGRDDSGAYLPAVLISDRPRFPWRGLMIDVSRHFQPVDAIKRQLDGMAAVKLNVLHWHLSDDQGVRVESKLFPKLQRLAAGGKFYTQSQVREIVGYARDRGIRVVPEFDMPGHSTAWFAAYPELASAPGPYQVEPKFGVFRPAFDPTREAVYDFIDRFVGEMAALFPDLYWHVGGDEVMPRHWNRNPSIRRFMRDKDLVGAPALQVYFNQRVARILDGHGRRMVGWDEILRPALPANTVIQAWRRGRWLVDGVAAGRQVIRSTGWYLDHMGTAEDYYKIDPVPAGMDSVGAALVLGGEACMWGEQLSTATLDSRIWPRAGAVAERLWSPARQVDVDDMYRRLAVVSRRLGDWGLGQERHVERMLAEHGPSRGRPLIARLLDLVQPVGFGERIHRQRPNQTTLFTNFVDAARPDPPIRREVARLVDGFLADAPGHRVNRDSLMGLFRSWKSLADSIGRLDQRQPMVADARMAGLGLGRLADAAETAVARLGQEVPADSAGFGTGDAAILAGATKPLGLVRLAVGASLQRLLTAAAGPRPSPMTAR